MGNNEDIEPDIERSLKWKELAIRIEHYKYYLNIALHVTAFFYAITGGVLGFYLKSPDESAKYHLEYFLLLPILIGSVLGGVFIYGARLQEKAIDSMEYIRHELLERLGLDVKQLHDAHLLNILLRIFGYIFFLVGALLVLLPFFIWSPFSKYLIGFSVTAIMILIAGGFLPIIARLIDNRLKKRRKRRGGDKINAWLKIIEAEGFNVSTLEDSGFYYQLRPYLSRKTVESIKDGTVTKDFLEQDIKKLKEKWDARETRIETDGFWNWLTAA